MTIYEKIKSMDINEYTEWFEANCSHNDDPSIKWFDETYCQKCESIFKDGHEYAYCELNHKCRFFENMNDVPDSKQTIKMWLESECNEKKKEEDGCQLILDGYYFEVGM